jgi:hypothetical protein
MSADPVRAARLLDLCMRHARTIGIAIDQLAQLDDADAELHTISARLLELALRAEPIP